MQLLFLLGVSVVVVGHGLREGDARVYFHLGLDDVSEDVLLVRGHVGTHTPRVEGVLFDVVQDVGHIACSVTEADSAFTEEYDLVVELELFLAVEAGSIYPSCVSASSRISRSVSLHSVGVILS